MIQRVVPGYKGFEVKSGSYEVRRDGYVAEEHTMSIPTFREYLQEALLLERESLSTKFEQYICDAWNVLYVGPKADPKATTLPEKLVPPAYQKAALNIARQLHVSDTGVRGQALVRTPAAKKTSPLYTGRDKTAKADIYAPGTVMKYSLKEAGGAQLISGHKEDITSIFNIAMSAFERADGNALDVEPMKKAIEDGIKNIKPPDGAENWIDVGHIRNAKKDGKPLELPNAVEYSGGIQRQALGVGVFYKKGIPNPLYKKYFDHLKGAAPLVHKFINAVHTQNELIKGPLQKTMTESFQNNPAFRNEFAYEAASGAGKFGGGNTSPIQVANRFLKFSTAGKLLHTHEFPDSSASTITSLASQLQFRLRWKHGTNVALAGDLLGEEKVEAFHNHEPTYQDMFREHMETYDTMMLNEGWASNARAALQGFRSWMGQFITKVLNKLSALARQGYRAVMRFLGLELESAALVRPVFV